MPKKRTIRKKPTTPKKRTTPKTTTTRTTATPRTTRKKPTTIDAYLAMVDGEQREALTKLRATIRAAAPTAEECISYGLPAFRVGAAVIAGFAATANGCSYYPFSGSTLATLASELADYSKTKSAVHFTPEAPLPVRLVRRLLAARIAELKR